MVVGVILFLAIPFLWAAALNQPINRRLGAAGLLVALLFFYLATKYRGDQASAPPAT